MVKRSIGWVFAVISALALTGCSNGVKERLYGRWVGDRIDNVSAEQIVRATGWVKGFGLELGERKMTVSVPGAEPRSGAFEIARADASEIVLAVEHPGAHPDDMRFFPSEDGRSLRWDVGGGREIVLVRTR